jgi:serine O-acetyltransferase
MFANIRHDIDCILARDPAARSRWEVVTCYPGFHAVQLHRLAHACWRSGFRWLGRFVSYLSRILTGIEIHPGAVIGRGVFIDHGMGVVIGETAEVGDGCTIYQGVTLGGTSLYKGTKRHPTLGRNVVVSAGAKVLGGFTVGDNARVGSNAVVLKPVPADATAVGIPARIIERKVDPNEAMHGEPAARPSGFSAYGVTQDDDPVSQALRGLVDSASSHDEQIKLIWAALDQLCKAQQSTVPGGAAKEGCVDAEGLKQLVK